MGRLSPVPCCGFLVWLVNDETMQESYPHLLSLYSQAINNLITVYSRFSVDKVSLFWYSDNTVTKKVLVDFRIEEVSMGSFKSEIDGLKDIGILREKKDRIKESVISPELNWNSRMELYQQVQMINTRIAQLSTQRKSHC